jgi:hypothetical protein
MSKTVTAIFETRMGMEDALLRLRQMGVMESQIGVVMSDEAHGRLFKMENNDKSDEGMAAGATLGGILGGIAAAVAGAGSIALPGLNLIIAGPVVAGLFGASLGAAAGGLVGGLVGLGIPEHEAVLYEGKIRGGHILLAIDARDVEQANKITKILQDFP